MLKRLSLLLLSAALVLGGSPVQAHHAPAKRLIVVFKDGSTRAQREELGRLLHMELMEDFEHLGIAVYEVTGEHDPKKFAKAGRVMGFQEDIYRNWLVAETAFAPLASMGAGLGGMVKFRSANENLPGKPAAPAGEQVTWGLKRLNVPDAWARGEGAGVRVAVIDTGVDCGHPDLGCDLKSGYNAVEPEKPPFDDNEHGTHVAGTIAARRDGKGVVGVAPKAVIIPVKVLDKDGAGSLSGIIRGINWAVKNKVQVINMSLGGDETAASLQLAVNRALKAGVVVVAAAGNSGPDDGTVGFPAQYEGVIAVAASDDKDGVAEFSSRGKAVALIAPGVDVLSTVPGGGYQRFSGTSMACPHVAGLAALAIERGAKGAEGVRNALLKTTQKLCPASACHGPTLQGAGLPDAAKL